MNHHGDRVPGRGRGCFGLPVGAAGHPLLPRLVPVDVAVDQHILASKNCTPEKPSVVSAEQLRFLTYFFMEPFPMPRSGK